jgi:hypothetical protein
LIAAVLFTQVGSAAAAAPAQTPNPAGIIQTIVPEKDATTGEITVVVTYTDALGATQTVRLTEAGATTLGLLQIDPATNLPAVDSATGLPLVDATKVNTDVIFDPTTVVPDTTTEEPAVHPISALLASFFGVDGTAVDELHQDGFGFGLIAQALWMTKNIGGVDSGDATLATCILEAKQSGDYTACGIDYGDDPVPTNWGQFKKEFSEKKNNLGSIVSGKAENGSTTDSTTQKEHGNGKDNNNGKGNGKGNGKNKP